MINRKIAPAVQEITTLDYLFPEEWKLENEIPVWGFNAGSQDLVKIDFIFDAGAWFQTENLIAGLTNAFMNQGSMHYSAQEIAEAFDSRGAYLQLQADQQFGSITLLTLNKYLNEILKVAADVIHHPTFPRKEIEAQIGKKKQQFTIENNKVKTLAQKKFSQVVFGTNHPYSNTNSLADYELLSPEKFIQFHQNYYSASHCKIIVAGRYDESFKKLLNQYFGKKSKTKREVEKVVGVVDSSPIKKHFILKEDALQSAIRIGCLIPNREHPDFHGLNVLVTILGGYFGSRLMANIREDKGYTYGIGAGIYSLPEAAYFSISTEVGFEVCENALKEIYFEMEKLRNEPVSEEELEIVRSYLLGENLRSFDGVFAQSSSLRTLLEAGVWYKHFDDFVKVVQQITPIQLKELAQNYFRREDLYEVVSGKKL